MIRSRPLTPWASQVVSSVHPRSPSHQISEHRGLADVGICGGGQQGHAVIGGQLPEVFQRLSTFRLSEFCPVPPSELVKLCGVMAVPLPQLGRRCHVFAPLIEPRPDHTHSARPEAIDQHPNAVEFFGLVVHPAHPDIRFPRHRPVPCPLTLARSNLPPLILSAGSAPPRGTTAGLVYRRENNWSSARYGTYAIYMQKISIEALASQQLAAAAAAASGRAADTVYGGHEKVLRQTVIGMVKGTRLAEHHNPGESTIFVLRGRVRLWAGEASWQARTGDLLIVPDALHSLEAEEDCAFLMTVAKTARRS